MRKFTLDSFGNSFGMFTLKFLESGKEEFLIPCNSKGEAINVRMRFHQYWKLLRNIPESQVPPGLVPYLPDIANLTSKAKDEFTVMICTKDQRNMDKSILGALDSLMAESGNIEGASAIRAATEFAQRPTAESVLKAAYGLDEEPANQPAKTVSPSSPPIEKELENKH